MGLGDRDPTQNSGAVLARLVPPPQSLLFLSHLLTQKCPKIARSPIFGFCIRGLTHRGHVFAPKIRFPGCVFGVCHIGARIFTCFWIFRKCLKNAPQGPRGPGAAQGTPGEPRAARHPRAPGEPRGLRGYQGPLGIRSRIRGHIRGKVVVNFVVKLVVDRLGVITVV